MHHVMEFQLSPKQVEALLYELGVVLGFCLPLDAKARLMQEPPADTDEFTDSVICAEGLDPHADIPLHLRRDIRARVAKHFKAAEDQYYNTKMSEH
jgi:hypothetical protein